MSFKISNSNPTSPTLISVESELLDIGNWAFSAAQYVGYVTLRTCKSKGLHAKWFSMACIRSVCILISSIAWTSYFFSYQRIFWRILKVFGTTELFSMGALIVVTTLSGNYLRVMGFWERTALLKFWKENCLTMERITVGGLEMRNPYGHLFQKVKTSIKNCILSFMIPGALHVIFVNGGFILHAFFREKILRSRVIGFFIGTAFWNWISFLHFGYPALLVFFLKLYNVGFQMIRLNLQDLATQQSNSKTLGSNIYLEEIFATKMTRVQLVQQAATATPDSTKNLDKKLRIILKTFHILEKQVESFNEFFGSKLIFEMLLCITNILVHSFFVCIWISRGLPLHVSFRLVPILLYILELYYLGTEAWHLTMTAQRITVEMQKLPLQKLSREMQLKVQLLVTSLSTNPPAIAPGQFFTLNRSSITSILCAIATFLVVLVQFKETDDGGIEKWFPTNSTKFYPNAMSTKRQ